MRLHLGGRVFSTRSNTLPSCFADSVTYLRFRPVIAEGRGVDSLEWGGADPRGRAIAPVTRAALESDLIESNIRRACSLEALVAASFFRGASLAGLTEAS
jgi:hypothetical protein